MEHHRLNNKEDTLAYLKQNNIEYHVEDHEQANTVAEGLEKVKTNKLKPEEFTFVKNLFLKNKAGGFYLVSANHVLIKILIFRQP